jgi:hypothetical protein
MMDGAESGLHGNAPKEENGARKHRHCWLTHMSLHYTLSSLVRTIKNILGGHLFHYCSRPTREISPAFWASST